jgi:hypothetical protein
METYKPQLKDKIEERSQDKPFERREVKGISIINFKV